MTFPIISRNRKEIRQAIGYNLGAMVVSAASSDGGDTTSLIDTYGMAKGGDDEYKGRQVLFTSGDNEGETSFIDSFTSSSSDATLSPAVTNTVDNGDGYEMWRSYTVEEINNAINQAIINSASDSLLDKVDRTIFTEDDRYEYEIPSDFVALHTVERVTDINKEMGLHACDVVWDELVDGDVTASLDTSINKEGKSCLKLVVAEGCGAGDILATDAIDSTDLSQYDEVELWLYSTVSLSAGDLQLLLDQSASCVSPVETLDIPATSADTWTRHVISLANPVSDSAIISLGVKMVNDKGAFTLYIDDVKAVDSNSRVFRVLPIETWRIVRGSTPSLKLNPAGLATAGKNTMLRISGYKLASVMTDDDDVSEIDPAYLVAATTGNILLSNARSQELDTRNRAALSAFWIAKAEKRLEKIKTVLNPNTRWL